jgi:thiol-disulfide isomerase/thioredoxin
MKKLIRNNLIGLISFTLISCSSYPAADHKVSVESNDTNSWTETTFSDFLLKFENDDTFLALLYAEGCPYCEKIIEENVPYIVSTKKYKLYAIKVDNASVTQDEVAEFKNYCTSTMKFFNETSTLTYIIRPITLVIENGEIFKYELGYTGTLNQFIDTYVE